MAEHPADGPVKNTFYELHKSFGIIVFAPGPAPHRAEALARGAAARAGAAGLAAGRGPRLALRALHPHRRSCRSPAGSATSVVLRPRQRLLDRAGHPAGFRRGGGRQGDLPRPLRALPSHSRPSSLVHVGAALHHHFVRRDATLLRMLSATGHSAGRERQQIGMPDRCTRRRGAGRKPVGRDPTFRTRRRSRPRPARSRLRGPRISASSADGSRRQGLSAARHAVALAPARPCESRRSPPAPPRARIPCRRPDGRGRRRASPRRPGCGGAQASSPL